MTATIDTGPAASPKKPSGSSNGSASDTAAAAEARNPASVMPIWMVARKRLGSRARRARVAPDPPPASRRRSWPSRSETRANSLPAKAALIRTSTATSTSWGREPSTGEHSSSGDGNTGAGRRHPARPLTCGCWRSEEWARRCAAATGRSPPRHRNPRAHRGDGAAARIVEGDGNNRPEHSRGRPVQQTVNGAGTTTCTLNHSDVADASCSGGAGRQCRDRGCRGALARAEPDRERRPNEATSSRRRPGSRASSPAGTWGIGHGAHLGGRLPHDDAPNRTKVRGTASAPNGAAGPISDAPTAHTAGLSLAGGRPAPRPRRWPPRRRRC